MEIDVWHGYQSGSLHDCQKIPLSDPFFVVTVPLRMLKSSGRKLMVIQKYKRLGFQICFHRMPTNNVGEETMSEFLAWKRMCISRLWMRWKEQVLKIVRVILVYAIVSLQEDNHVNLILGRLSERNKTGFDEKKSGFRPLSGRPIYIKDDITQLRARLLKSLKE